MPTYIIDRLETILLPRVDLLLAAELGGDSTIKDPVRSKRAAPGSSRQSAGSMTA